MAADHSLTPARRAAVEAAGLASVDVGPAVAADDAYGASHGLVVQGDGLPWAGIDGLLVAALYGREVHRQLAHAGAGSRECETCAEADAMWNTALVDPVLARRRVTATELFEQVRARVRADLARS